MFITHIYRLYGIPQRVISDRGIQFTAKFWKEFLVGVGSSQGLSTAFHPATNGAVERTNAMIERYLRCYIDHQQTNWADLLPHAEVVYNNAVHSSSGCTPFQVVTGRDFVPIPECPHIEPAIEGVHSWMAQIQKMWRQANEVLQQSMQKYKLYADKKRIIQPDFQVGQLVYLSTKYIKLKSTCKKLGPKFLGPFPIVRVINPVTVKLRLPKLLGKIHPVFHCNLLRPVHTSHIQGRPTQPPPPIMVDGEQHYEIRWLLDTRWHRGRLQYLVLWKGYPLAEATWI